MNYPNKEIDTNKLVKTFENYIRNTLKNKKGVYKELTSLIINSSMVDENKSASTLTLLSNINLPAIIFTISFSFFIKPISDNIFLVITESFILFLTTELLIKSRLITL